MAHYHIVWEMNGDSRIDYAAFENREEAKRYAARLVRHREQYHITEYVNECGPDCPAWKSRYRESLPKNPREQ